MKPRLLIISDTRMRKYGNSFQAFEPVVREVSAFQNLFSKITWIGFRYDNTKNDPGPFADINYQIKTIMLNPSGGETLFKKILIIPKLPRYIYLIFKNILLSDVIHTRSPSIPAFIGIILSYIFPYRKYWNKYAGNWVQNDPPFSYALQKKVMEFCTNSIVTINGKWYNQKKHVHTFLNPCFDQSEYLTAKEIAGSKNYSSKLNLCFVGRMEAAKGPELFIDALEALQNNKEIGHIYFVGEGPEKEKYIEKSNALDCDITFTGSIKRHDLNKIYKICHLIILPTSASEGFPKVISEAMSFGCVPIVTNISSLSQYVNYKNGILINDIDKNELISKINILLKNRSHLTKLGRSSSSDSKAFTYESYVRYVNLILSR